MTKEENTKLIDATGRTLGRVASEAAFALMGKNKPSYERHKYSGMDVSIFNASKIKIIPAKLEEIFHTRYSGYPGGLRVTKAKETVKNKGFKELLKLSIYHMLPGNKIRREMMKHLTIEN